MTEKYNSEYIKLTPSINRDLLEKYWQVAKGLQKADGLNTSEYLETVISDTLDHKYDVEEAIQKMLHYYSTLPAHSDKRASEQADIVAARITARLRQNGFKLSIAALKSIHGDIFRDFPHSYPGEFRNGDMFKPEKVLNYDTVDYALYSDIERYLEYDFWQERQTRYHLPFTSEQINSLIRFISGIWQTHPFNEGNTRTISVFLIQYLRSMGIKINNDPFKDNSDWFRDALARANYTNLEMDIYPDTSFLKMFFENILSGTENDLYSVDMSVKTDGILLPDHLIELLAEPMKTFLKTEKRNY